MIVLTGLSHHTATIDIREQAALSNEDARAVARELADHADVGEVFVISTCNRVEIIAVSQEDDEASAERCSSACREAIVQRCPAAERSLYAHAGVHAVRHLFRVAASLDSLVVGEAQILGQLKQGFESGREESTVGATLHQLFARAARGAKRVRSETAIGVGQVSVPSIAVELAQQIFGDLSGRRAALIGAGEMGQTVARLLKDAGAELTVIGRSEQRVAPVAARIGGTARLMEDIPAVLSDVDVVVSSTSAPTHVVTREHLKARKKARRGGNLFFIDLAVPRDIEPEIGQLDGVFLYDVDDLAQVASESAGSRQRAAEEAEKIVEEGVVEWGKRQNAQAVVPTIKALRAKMRAGLEEELGKSLRGRLRELDEEQRSALAKMLDAGLNRILHEPVTRLREGATQEESEGAEEAATVLADLFELSSVPDEDLDVSSVRIPETQSGVSYLPDATEEARREGSQSYPPTAKKIPGAS